MTSPETPAGPPTADEGTAPAVDGVATEPTEAPDDSAPRSSGPTPAGGSAAPAHRRKRKGTSFWKELPFLVLIALVLALLIKTFLVQAFYIPSSSMENTLQGGFPDKHHDRVLVNKLVYRFRAVHRGEIVVFRGPQSWQDAPEFTSTPPSNPISRFFHDIGSALGVAAPSNKDFIKRVIGVGGDHVVCCDAQGRITVNNVPLNETGYLYRDATTHRLASPSDRPFDVTVPKGRLWVMGDNRANSLDSRGHMTDHEGTIPTSDVIGRAFVVVWPPSDWRTLPVPGTFGQKGLAAAATVLGNPLGMGFVGAVPITLVRRRWRRRRQTGGRPAH